MKTTNFFSKPLFAQNMKTYRILILAVILIMIMMSSVITAAMDAMEAETVLEIDPAVLAQLGITLPEMDPAVMLNMVYFKVAAFVPIFLLVVVLSNALISAQVDNGSMAYILSAPVKRKAVAITNMIFMILVPLAVLTVICAVKCILNQQIMGDAEVQVTVIKFIGMYAVTEAIAAICYLGSCIFNQNSRALAFGGGITVWCFIAALLGLFGSEQLTEMGIGIEQLDIFNHLTLVGLFDAAAIETVGTGNVDEAFIWKLAVLAVIAAAAYIAGAVKFQKKDLPL